MTDTTQAMTSDNINELAKALSKAQGAITGASRDKTNPFFKGSKYADLGAIMEACKEPLHANGLSVSQTTEMHAMGPVLVTRLMHMSGQWIKGVMPLLMGKNDMQAMGSAITYSRRYALAAIVGVAPEDDDGNKACEPPRQQVITTAQAGQIKYMLSEIDDPNLMMHILTSCNVRAIEQVPAERFTKLMAWLEGKRTPKVPEPVALITPQEIVEASGDEMTAEERAGVFL